MANFVSYANAEELMQGIADKFAELGGAYIFRGSLTFANVPTTLTAGMVGYVYNVTDDFTTTALFVEGAGKKYSAGTNVVVANVGDDTTPDYKLDVLGNFVDVDALEDKIQAVSDMITGEFDDTENYAVGDVVVHDGKLYKCTTAHDAGAWAAADFAETTVAELIESAEPEALTSAQVTALLALLG